VAPKILTAASIPGKSGQNGSRILDGIHGSPATTILLASVPIPSVAIEAFD
jgi:hypothetical protein